MFDKKYLPFVVGATLLMTSQPILTTLSKVNGHYKYVQISTTLLAEFTKLAFSTVLYARLPPSQHSHRQLSTPQLILFAVPGLIYFINNNLIFVILQYVNSTTYQILSSLKTVFTGILFRVLLKRKLTDLQMLAIVLLSCGTATSQARHQHTATGTRPSPPSPRILLHAHAPCAGPATHAPPPLRRLAPPAATTPRRLETSPHRWAWPLPSSPVCSRRSAAYTASG